jgi:hypothetical protein
VFQNPENPAATSDEDAILWEERKEFILAITLTLFMYHYCSLVLNRQIPITVVSLHGWVLFSVQ